jgi:hypothetical protein
MCIRTQEQFDHPPDIRCLPNGIALSPDEGGEFWREGCTDPSWESDYCLKAFDACPIVGIPFLGIREMKGKLIAKLRTNSWHGIGCER